MASNSDSTDPITIFNIVAGLLVLFGVMFIRNENQKGFFYKLGN